MSVDPEAITSDHPDGSVELPRSTVAPLVLALGMALMAAGVAAGVAFAFAVVGAAVLIFGLGLWVAQLLPGKGHVFEPRVDPSMRPREVAARVDGVGRMQEGMPGSRLRLPTEVHPISAGLKGGLIGGLLMPIPALIWGVSSGHGIWYPANLLAGLALPGLGTMSVAELEAFRPGLLVLALTVHVLTSSTLGLIYGVLMPTLPKLPPGLAWGALAMPMLWTALTFGLMGVVNPLLAKGVDWPWFIASQFVFGVVTATVIARLDSRGPLRAGMIGGVAGGLAMPIPAVVWSWATGKGIWYPANLLAGLVVPGMDKLPLKELEAFHPGWLGAALAIHSAMSIGLGVAFGLLVPRFRPIPSTLAWGGLLMPLLWTSGSFALMGVVNPLLQGRVDWPWFIASQFVFGVATAIVVERSERVFIPPAGRGAEPTAAYAVGQSGGGS